MSHRSVLLLLALVGCSEDEKPLPYGDAASYTIERVSGQGQTVAHGQPLPEPLVALVRDRDGRPVANVAVTWSAGGSLYPLLGPVESVTGSDGRALFAGVANSDPNSIFNNITARISNGKATGFVTYAFTPPLHITAFQRDYSSTTCVGLAPRLTGLIEDSHKHIVAGTLTWTGTLVPGDSLVRETTLAAGGANTTLVLGNQPGVRSVIATFAGFVSNLVTITAASPCPATSARFTDATAFVPATGSLPLTVTAYNDSGTVVRNARVRWGGAGSLASISPEFSVTGQDGTATVTATFAAIPGTFYVTATLDENQNVPVVGTQLNGTVFPPTPPIVGRFTAPPGTTSLNTIRIRDGLAFVAAANSGVLIYDVGNGIKGGSPANPQFVSQAITSSDGLGIGVAAYSTWWFQNPVTGQKRYLFVGQSWGNAGDQLGTSGNLHVVDVSDLTHPVEVASLHSTRGAFHDLVMDESRQVLYAALGSGGGILRIPVSGVLSGDISGRIDGQADPSGTLTSRIWGLALFGGSLVASDVDRGFFFVDPVSFTGQYSEPRLSGSTDLWVAGNQLFSGVRAAACQPTDEVGARLFNGAVEINQIGNYPLLASGCAISDVSGSADGKIALFSVLGGSGKGRGLWFYRRSNGLNTPVGWFKDTIGVRASEYAVINGRSYVFALREGPSIEIVVFDVTGLLTP